MKKIIIILTTLLLLSCKVSRTTEYQQSLCSVDKKGFLYKADSENNNSHRVNISGNKLYFESNELGNFVNNLGTSIKFTYSGTNENGIFSYKDNSMNAPMQLGIIHFYCWKALKRKYNRHLSFSEAISN